MYHLIGFMFLCSGIVELGRNQENVGLESLSPIPMIMEMRIIIPQAKYNVVKLTVQLSF